MTEDRRQPRLHLADLVLRQNLEFPVAPAQQVQDPLRLAPAGVRLEHGQEACMADVGFCPGFPSKETVGFVGVIEQLRLGARVRLDPRRRAVQHEMGEPGRDLRQVAPADGQRPVGVEQHLGDAFQHIGRGGRNDAAGADHAGIAGGSARARVARVEQCDGMTVAAQENRRADARYPTADDAHAPRGRSPLATHAPHHPFATTKAGFPRASPAGRRQPTARRHRASSDARCRRVCAARRRSRARSPARRPPGSARPPMRP